MVNSTATAKLLEILGINNPNFSKYLLQSNLRQKVAREMSYVVWGNGINFMSLDKELVKTYQEFKVDNNLFEMLAWNEFLLSLSGRTIVCLNKTKTDNYMLTIPNIYFAKGVSKSFVKPQAAVIYQRFTYDDRLYIVRSEYTTTYCKNDLYTMNDDKVITLGMTSDIYEKLQVVPYWEHNLGFVPVVEFTNLPAPFAFWQNTDYVELSDWIYGVQYEDAIYETLINLRRELELCHSRAFVGDADQNTINTLNKKIQSNSETIDYLGTYVMNAGFNNQVTVVPGVGDFTKYTKTLNDLLDIYFKSCGSARFSEGGGAQKTYADTSSQYKNRNEFTTYKTNLRLEKLNELLFKFFRCCGFDETKSSNFILKMNNNIDKNDTNYIENKMVLIQNSIISPIDWIQDYYECSEQQAKEIFEKNKKINQEIQKEQIEQMKSNYEPTINADGKHENWKEN